MKSFVNKENNVGEMLSTVFPSSTPFLDVNETLSSPLYRILKVFFNYQFNESQCSIIGGNIL